MLVSLALAVLTLSGSITVGQVLALMLAQGIVTAFDTLARQSFVIQMVGDPADPPNAIALNASLVNGSRMIGPAAGGALIASIGAGGCFLPDAVSYGFVIGSLLAMRTAPPPRPMSPSPVLDSLVAGYRYVAGFARCARVCCSSRPSARSGCRTTCSCLSSSPTFSAAMRVRSAG